MEWINLLKDLGIFGIIVAGSSWLIKKHLEKLLDKDLEKFKANLEKNAIEFKIRYEKLHGERVEVIKEVYKKIVRVSISLYTLIIIGPPQPGGESGKEIKKKAEIVENNMDDLRKYYEENRIFFDEEMAKDVDSLLDIFLKAKANFIAAGVSRMLRDPKTEYSQWQDAWELIEKETPKIKEQLENKFRNIIGINL